MNKKKIVSSLVGVGVLAVAAYGAWVSYDLSRTYPEQTQTLAPGAMQAKIARGAYVATASDCVACHTAAGGKPFAGGYKIDTPFGPILSSNITSDKKTGIGSWNQSQFDAAVRHGKGSHGYLYPAMPYPAYAKLTDDDLNDLWAYMQTVPAISHSVNENQLPFPYNQRWVLGGWNLLFFHATTFNPEKQQSAQLNRGQYLVEGPGHCAACHTGKNILGGDVAETLTGTTLQGWHAPDLTSNSHVGLGRWQQQDLVDYLQNGTNRYAVASGPMAEAVENSTQHMTQNDLQAIASWLKQLPASSTAKPVALTQTESLMQQGKSLYETQCSACHVSGGEGIRNMIPALANNPQLNASDPASLLTVVLKGSDGVVTQGNPTAARMPRFDWKLSDQQVAAVTTYIRNSWGNAAPAVTEQTVEKARTALSAQAWHAQ